MSASAVAAYQALLRDRELAEASARALRAGQKKRRLYFGDRPLSISLRPNLMTPARFRAAAQAAEAVYSALQALEKALLTDDALRRELDLDAGEEQLALADPGCRSASSSARLDGFYSDRLRFVEFNAESPAGMAYSDNLAEAFEEMPVMKAFRRRFRLRRLPNRAHQLAAMLRAFRQWGRDRKPTVAIVDWKGLPTAPEFEMFQDFFRARGVRTLICDPRELELRRDRLVAGRTPVNLVYRRVLTTELLARGPEARALADAYLAGACCVVNTFRAKLLHKKMSLALLSDPRYERLYTPAQRRAVARHVPWTRKVVPALAEQIAKGRERLVLKPNDEYGGKGVTLGWDVDQRAWEKALAEALTQPYVVQEAVPVPRQAFPVLLDGIRVLDLALDLDPYLFDGRVGGVMTRLSSAALLNVTAGAGSVVPTYLVEGSR